MHLMSKKFDDGPILDQIVYKNTDDLIERMSEKSHSLSVDLLKRNLNNIYMKKIKLKKIAREIIIIKKIIRTTTLKEKQK